MNTSNPAILVNKHQIWSFIEILVVIFNAVITPGSLIRALLDYVCIALKGTGCITIGDAPIQSCFF